MFSVYQSLIWGKCGLCLPGTLIIASENVHGIAKSTHRLESNMWLFVTQLSLDPNQQLRGN
jgi:hypothetical protein